MLDHIKGERDGFGLIEVLAQIGRACDPADEDDRQSKAPDGGGVAGQGVGLGIIHLGERVSHTSMARAHDVFFPFALFITYDYSITLFDHAG